MHRSILGQLFIGLAAALAGCGGPNGETIDSFSAPLERKVDFNNDGSTDLLWHNGTTGQTQAWSLNGANRVGLINFDPSLNVLDSSGWTPVGIVDAVSNLSSTRRDVIWHNGTTGQTQVWFMDTTGNRTLTVTLPPELDILDSSGWRLVATGNFDANGVPDWVWHNGQTGQTQIWFMDSNLNRTSFANLDSSLNVADNSGWKIVGADDFNSNGLADLLWHNGTTGETQVWYMLGFDRTDFAQLDASLNLADGTGWRIVDINDFNGDLSPDIVWHNGTNGQTQIWHMSNTSRTGFITLDSSLNVADSTGWRIVRD